MGLKQSAPLLALVLCSSFAGGMLAVLAVNRAVSAEENVVRSQRFEAIDLEGKPGARFGVDTEGKSYLELLDKTGKARVSAGVAPNGSAAIGMLGRDDRKRAEIAVGSDGTPSMALLDRSGKAGVTLRLDPQDAPSLALLDGDGGPIALLSKNEDGTWKLVFPQPVSVEGAPAPQPQS